MRTISATSIVVQAWGLVRTHATLWVLALLLSLTESASELTRRPANLGPSQWDGDPLVLLLTALEWGLFVVSLAVTAVFCLTASGYQGGFRPSTWTAWREGFQRTWRLLVLNLVLVLVPGALLETVIADLGVVPEVVAAAILFVISILVTPVLSLAMCAVAIDNRAVVPALRLAARLTRRDVLALLTLSVLTVAFGGVMGAFGGVLRSLMAPVPYLPASLPPAIGSLPANCAGWIVVGLVGVLPSVFGWAVWTLAYRFASGNDGDEAAPVLYRW